MTTPAAAPVPPHPEHHRSFLGAARARRHNPLLRRTDRQRTWLRALFVLGLALTVALSAAVGALSYRSSHAAALREAAQLHEVRAVAVSDAAHPPSAPGTAYTAQVRWTDAGGATHLTSAVVPAATASGSLVQVWLDANGRARTAPTTVTESAGNATLTGLYVLVGLGVVVLTTRGLVRLRLDRVDARNWERDWIRVEQDWTRRR